MTYGPPLSRIPFRRKVIWCVRERLLSTRMRIYERAAFALVNAVNVPSFSWRLWAVRYIGLRAVGDTIGTIARVIAPLAWSRRERREQIGALQSKPDQEIRSRLVNCRCTLGGRPETSQPKTKDDNA